MLPLMTTGMKMANNTTSHSVKTITWSIFQTSMEVVLTADSLDSPEPDAITPTKMASGSVH